MIDGIYWKAFSPCFSTFSLSEVADSLQQASEEVVKTALQPLCAVAAHVGGHPNRFTSDPAVIAGSSPMNDEPLIFDVQLDGGCGWIPLHFLSGWRLMWPNKDLTEGKFLLQTAHMVVDEETLFLFFLTEGGLKDLNIFLGSWVWTLMWPPSTLPERNIFLQRLQTRLSSLSSSLSVQLINSPDIVFPHLNLILRPLPFVGFVDGSRTMNQSHHFQLLQDETWTSCRNPLERDDARKGTPQ